MIKEIFEHLADISRTALVGHLTTSPLWLSTAGEADVGVTHQRQLGHYLYGAGECINGTVSALERLKCKIYEVSIQIEWFLVVI